VKDALESDDDVPMELAKKRYGRGKAFFQHNVQNADHDTDMMLIMVMDLLKIILLLILLTIIVQITVTGTF
jgi:hypothetical protein